MTATMPPDTLAGYTDAELTVFYGQAVATDNAEWAQILEAECERRDRADREERASDVQARAELVRRRAHAKYRATGDQADWYEAAHAQFLAAEKDCAGQLLSAEGMKATSQPMTLWTGTEKWARRLASEELCNWWDANGRLTFSQYRRQAAASRLEQREAYRNEELDRDDQPGRVRHDAGQGQGAAAGGDSRGVNVPGSAAVADAVRVPPAAAVAGPVRDAGHVRGPGRGGDEMLGHLVERAVVDGVRAAARADRTRTAADIKRRTDEIRAGRPDPGAAVAVPSRGHDVAVRAPDIPGSLVLDLTRAYLANYVALPSASALATVTAWVAHAVARDRDDTGVGPLIWRASPRLLATSRNRGAASRRCWISS